MYYFHVGATKSGAHSWWLYSPNHEQVAWAGETFASPSNAQRAAAAFKLGAATARYDIYVDGGVAWRWRAWRSSDKVAASGESFSSPEAAEDAADRVRRNAGGATL